MQLERVKESSSKGYSLLEFLLVMAIIAILVGIIIIAIHPGKNLGHIHNVNRRTAINTIIDGIHQYALDNNGVLPTVGTRLGAVALSATPTEVCSTTATSCAGLVDLAILTASDKYIVAIPKDPQCPAECSANGTGYFIAKDINNRLIVSAPNAENGKTISVNK
ncbi:MAG TPA: prepilin-type N-terminal cleavage/methylation domain-containing protein [Patescibacteria group bacterium]|jgi:prepilin-type N-terminal cleavage/methylation domain-containing protein|nr:prepilin-type N-terminal cleavage/methylation domain-containing protein [Patescibacteria group bacterium]